MNAALMQRKATVNLPSFFIDLSFQWVTAPIPRAFARIANFSTVCSMSVFVGVDISKSMSQRFRISTILSGSRIRGFAVFPFVTHLKCSSVDPSWAGRAGVTLRFRVSTSRFLVLQ